MIFSMKWTYSIGVLLFFSILACEKNELELNSDLPNDKTFAVETQNSEIPYLKIKTSSVILNEPKVEATLEIYQNKKGVLKVPIGVEYRGSTSYRLSDKKSYGIETRDKSGNAFDVSLLGFPAENDWVLIGDVYNITDKYMFDPTLLSNFVAYSLAQNMGQYASRNKFVELEINGQYMGLYLFAEKLKRGKERINIAKLSDAASKEPSISGGYILKIDKTAGSDVQGTHTQDYYLTNWGDDLKYTASNSFRSDFGSDGKVLNTTPFVNKVGYETYFLYEYPKATAINKEQKAYISTYIRDFEKALLADNFSSDTRTYTQYIDVDSFVDFLIINELCGNIDGYRLSTYLNKDLQGKLKMGPVWDFNIGYFWGGRVPQTDWIFNYNKYVKEDAWLIHFWWQRLMEDPQFKNALKKRWLALRSNQFSNTNLSLLVDNQVSYLISNGAIERNFKKWNAFSVNFQQKNIELKDYLKRRATWIDSQVNQF